MLSFSSAVKIFLCIEPTDMRRSFDALAMMVKNIIDQDPLSGHIFVFANRRAGQQA
jgi:transposase